MSKLKVNLRKQVQIIKGDATSKYNFLSIYKSNSKKHEELLIAEDLDEVKEIYNNWNTTLKPHEKKRIFIKAFKVRPVLELTLIKE